MHQKFDFDPHELALVIVVFALMMMYSEEMFNI